MTANEIRAQLEQLGSPERAEVAKRYFKTGPGEYGEGDIFYGISAHVLRQLAREHQALADKETLRLLRSPVHEARCVALLILVRAFAKGDQTARQRIYETYLANTRFINNWDLVDVSAPHIIGAHLADKSRKPLEALARSQSLWERRIAIISTFYFIRTGEYANTLRIAKLLLGDKEDLIHKAVGWMLREVGKRDRESEVSFLKEHYKLMPRTMLRYAIERFPEAERQMYLKGTI
jgi:3-methyladenine DNA glycosylase AlkD